MNSIIRRSLTTALFSIATAIACAQQFGTKHDPVTSQADPAASTGMGFMPFFQMLLALGIVMALIKFGMPKLLTKLNKRLVTGVDSNLRVEESAVFAGGNLYIVSAKSKTLLLSVTQSGVTCLADITDPAPKQELPVFMDVLEGEESKPEPAYTPELYPSEALVQTGGLTDDQIRDALNRLSRLGR